MKDFLLSLVKQIVDQPSSVEVEETSESGVIVLKLTVAREDMGKVIGKGGRIIRSIRDLVRVIAVKENVRVNVIIAEEYTPNPPTAVE